MGTYGVLLIAALILVSGVIAYVGDFIGRRMGRRRLTLFGLRPRHSAIVVSVAAGMIIAAWTLGASMALSRDVRDAFTRVDALRAQTSKLLRSNRRLELVRSKLENEVEQSRQDVRKALSARKRAQEQLRSSLEELASEKVLLARQHRELHGLQTQLRQSAQQLSERKREVAELSSQARALRQEVRELEQERKNALRIVLAQERERQNLSSEIRAARAWLDRLASGYQALYTGPVIIHSQETLHTAVIEAGRPAEQVRADLLRFIDQVNEIARTRGAGTGDSGRAISFSRPVIQAGGGAAVYNEQAVFDRLIEDIRSASGRIIVRAVSLGNAVEKETVLVDFELIPDAIVFRKGEVLGTSQVDPTMPEAKIMRALVDLLQELVGPEARRRGILPSPQELSAGPSFLEQPREPVGAVRYEDLERVVRNVREASGPVQVVVKASDDIWRSGPVRVELAVAELKETAGSPAGTSPVQATEDSQTARPAEPSHEPMRTTETPAERGLREREGISPRP
jgi:uncharacterized protein (DUF3084 family)